MTLHDDLVAAKALISDPDDWCKGVSFARKADGSCAYCAAGATWYATLSERRATAAEMALGDQVPPDKWNRWRWVRDFNDHRYTTHADIMALFDRAIASALHSTEGERK